MKSESERARVEATSPPTFTLEPFPNNIPFGLIRKILPLAVRSPRISDGSAPSTRLSATELELGWTKTTLLSLPIENVCQLIAACWLDWVMVTVWPLLEMVALPAVTVPPVGALCAWAGAARPSIAAAAIEVDPNSASLRRRLL